MEIPSDVLEFRNMVGFLETKEYKSFLQLRVHDSLKRKELFGLVYSIYFVF